MTGRAADQPIRYPVNLQIWRDLTFLHWPVDPAQLQVHLPAGLQVDTHDGQGWIGITPLLMRDVRPPGVPPVPHLSHFPELNLRTYVRRPDGATGIWFFSLDCPRLATVAALRLLGLPYFWAEMDVSATGEHLTYRARRRGGAASLDVTVRAGSPLAEHDALTTFLTGRWAAYTWRGHRLWRVPIEHEPWPLRHATARVADTTVVRAAGLPEVAGEPLAHFSPGVERVRIGLPRPG